jgi:exodeoxyribonuclease V alpha subunit
LRKAVVIYRGRDGAQICPKNSEETGFCVLRVKVREHRDLVTIVGSAATITPGEYIEGQGVWVNDRTHGLQFKT